MEENSNAIASEALDQSDAKPIEKEDVIVNADDFVLPEDWDIQVDADMYGGPEDWDLYDHGEIEDSLDFPQIYFNVSEREDTDQDENKIDYNS